MKIGDYVKLVRAPSNHDAWEDSILDSGIIIDIRDREYSFGKRRIATILHNRGEIQTWPLDSHYTVEVIYEAR